MLPILGKKIQSNNHHNKSILNIMRMFVIISIARAQHEIIAIGTQQDFGKGECDIECDEWTSQYKYVMPKYMLCCYINDHAK